MLRVIHIVINLLLLSSVLSIDLFQINSFKHAKYFYKSHSEDLIHLYYPHDKSLSIALSNQISHINNKYSNDKESKDIYHACCEYLQYNEIIKLLDKKPDILYSSFKDNLICYSIDLTLDHIKTFHSIINSTNNQLLPIPRLLKMDSSIAATLYYMSSAYFNDKSSDCNNPRKCLNSHPLISDIIDNSFSTIDLSIAFGKNITIDKMKELYNNWYSKLENIDSSSVNALLLHLPNSNSKNHYRIIIPHYSHLSNTKNSYTITNNLWDHINVKSNTLIEKSDYSTHCQWTKILNKVTYRSNNIIISIPSTYVNQLNQYSSSCLTIMLLLITESGQIRKIGFSTPMHLLNNVARGVTQSGIANNEPFTNIGLTGRNIVVGIADTGIDENSCFFNDSINGVIPRSDLTNLYYNLTYRKVVQYVTYSDSLGDVSSGHGSHVAGTVAGSCIDNSKSNYNGMAKDSKIAFFDIASTDGTLRFPAHMSELYKASYHAKATIQSNSWGGGYWYDTFSQETDEYLYYNDDMTIIYAGGNSGTSGYQTIMSPSLSKNVISVGATETGRSLQNINKIPYFSSVGPAPDNRFKPDILSPGYVIYSADSKNELISKYSCKVSTKFGTSMSAPNVAGNAALIQQYFNDKKFWYKYCNPLYKLCQFNSFKVIGSLTKALILHSGESVNEYNGRNSIGVVSLSDTPDIYQGYGRLKLTNILLTNYYNISNHDLFIDIITLYSFTESLYDILITDGYNKNIPLKITISWYDPPNEIFSAKVLLHDIDLLLIDPFDNVYYGNQIDNERDELNTNEQIIIYEPVSGVWTVRIQSKLLTQSLNQKVSIVITSPSGVVYGSKSSDLLSDISSLDMNSCSWNSSKELEISLWSQETHESWSENSYYTIYNYNSNISIYSNRLIGERLYQLDTLCISPGCYDIELHLDEGNTSAGTQLSIPDCSNIFLSALSKKQSFCIHTPVNISIYKNDAGSRNVLDYPMGSCVSSVQIFSHIILSIYLIEFSGGGWLGAYYAIIEMDDVVSNYLNNISHDNITSYKPSNKNVFSTAGTLEWGFYEKKDIYLPYKNKCYYMLLSSPIIDDFHPNMIFINSTNIYNNQESCGRPIQSNESLAMICVDIDNDSISINHYRYGSIYDNDLNKFLSYYITTIGQKDGSLEELVNVYLSDELIPLDNCVINGLEIKSNAFDYNPLDIYNPTSAPTNLPSNIPTKLPTRKPTPKLIPSPRPTRRPSRKPTIRPSRFPTLYPTSEPTARPSFRPISFPSSHPTIKVNTAPTSKPNSPWQLVQPSSHPTREPSNFQTMTPHIISTGSPTLIPQFPTINPVNPWLFTVPSSHPTREPSQVIPTAIPTVLSTLPFKCFESCQDSNYNYTNFNDFFIFLLAKVFNRCNSYSLIHGLCQIPACASSCSIETFCYYGIGSLNNGKYHKIDSLSNSSYYECINSYNSNNNNNSDNNTYVSYNLTTLLSDDTIYSTTKRHWTLSFYLIIGVMIFLQIISFWFIVEYVWYGKWNLTSIHWIISYCCMKRSNPNRSNSLYATTFDESSHDLSSSQHNILLSSINPQTRNNNSEYEMVPNLSSHS